MASKLEEDYDVSTNETQEPIEAGDPYAVNPPAYFEDDRQHLLQSFQPLTQPSFQPATQPNYQLPPPVVMQPQMTSHNTTVVINSVPPPVQMPRQWSSGICDCCNDMNICCCVLFCQMCAAYRLTTDMEENCCVPYCVPGWLIVLRTKLRMQLNISGDVMDDCCMVCCCGHCVMCQMLRETQLMRTANNVRVRPY